MAHPHPQQHLLEGENVVAMEVAFSVPIIEVGAVMGLVEAEEEGAAVDSLQTKPRSRG